MFREDVAVAERLAVVGFALLRERIDCCQDARHVVLGGHALHVVLDRSDFVLRLDYLDPETVDLLVEPLDIGLCGGLAAVLLGGHKGMISLRRARRQSPRTHSDLQHFLQHFNAQT